TRFSRDWSSDVCSSDLEDGLFAETVYSGADGAFRLETRQSGNLEVRARRPGYADTVLPLTLDADGRADLTLSLQPLGSPQAISRSEERRVRTRDQAHTC